MDPVFYSIGYILVPVGVNVAFGPSIYAFLHHKKSRVMILILNLIVGGSVWVAKDVVWPAWADWSLICAMLLLVIWALRSRVFESAGSTSIVYLILIAHVCAIAAVAACVNYGLYKSPERRVAEEMLKHRTIKWEHDGKTEYFRTHDPESADYDYVDSGLSYTESASTGLFDYNGAYRTRPVSTGAFDQNGHFKGDEHYTIWFYNDRLTIERSGQHIKISYEQLFKSKDIELIDSHTKPNLLPAAMGRFAFPGYSLPGQYGWQYDADNATRRAFRYGWEYYFNGVQYRGYVDSECKLYVSIYGDHGENLDSFLFAGWLDGSGANGTFTHSHDWSRNSWSPYHVRGFSQTYLFGKAVEMP
jgi:hypothetical protein